jgi:hypothetical protein
LRAALRRLASRLLSAWSRLSSLFHCRPSSFKPLLLPFQSLSFPLHCLLLVVSLPPSVELVPHRRRDQLLFLRPWRSKRRLNPRPERTRERRQAILQVVVPLLRKVVGGFPLEPILHLGRVPWDETRSTLVQPWFFRATDGAFDELFVPFDIWACRTRRSNGPAFLSWLGVEGSHRVAGWHQTLGSDRLNDSVGIVDGLLAA